MTADDGGIATDRGTNGETPEPAAPDPVTRDPTGGEAGRLLPPGSEETPTLSVVLPTLNEEEGIGECIERIRAALDDLGVNGEVVVADSSTDRTPEIAASMDAHVVHPDEEGYGYAYQYAFERCRGEYVAMGDADTTYDFRELPKLYAHVANGEADMAMGSRLDGEIRDGAMPTLHRYVGNPLLTRFLNLFYDADISDAHSGMRVMSRDALAEMDPSTTGMEFASEMVMEAGARDLTIVEEPITYHERVGEATLNSFEDGWRHLRFMLLNAPGYLFSAPGGAMTLLGVAVMALAASNVTLGGATFGIHSLVAGSLLTIVGTQVVSFGLFATQATDPVNRPDDPITDAITETVSLEAGATAGGLVFLAGAGYAAVLTWEWVATGFAALPVLTTDILAFTGIVLGLQVFFGSFLMSALGSVDR